MQKKWLVTICVGVLVLVMLSGTGLAHGYRLEVNGRTVSDADPLIHQGQLVVWSRPLANDLGLSLGWDGADRRIDLARGGSQVAFWLGSRTVFRNGVRYTAPVAPFSTGGQAYLPVWFTAALFGDTVTWDGQTMHITTRAGGQTTPLDGRNFIFPFPEGVTYQRDYADNYGDGRDYGTDGVNTRQHTGIDILAPKGTPVVAAGSGRVIRYGWNEYGGWRLTVELDEVPGWRFYYAHLNGYGPNLYEGARVRAGQLIGYVGNTGYGPEGTQGQFVPHLHFGVYKPDWSTINPFLYLKRWENNRARLS